MASPTVWKLQRGWGDTISQGERHHAHLLLEFIAGARSEGLAEVLAEKHLRSLEQFRLVVEEGKNEGKIPGYVDPAQVSWLITGWAFAGDVAHQMGFESFFDPNIVVHWLDVIFESFAAPPPKRAHMGSSTDTVRA